MRKKAFPTYEEAINKSAPDLGMGGSYSESPSPGTTIYHEGEADRSARLEQSAAVARARLSLNPAQFKRLSDDA